MTCSDTQVYSTLFTCFCDQENVDLLWNPASLDIPQEMSKDVRRHWDALPKDHIFNGKLARLDQWAFTPDGCQLELRPTNYRTLLYSNQHVRHICDTWGKRYLSRALGISAVVVSSDDYLVFMQRSNNVGEFPGCYDVFGGHIDIPKNDGSPNIFTAMAQELQEEVAIQQSEYDLKLIGLINSIPNQKPELVFRAQVELPAKEILARTREAKDHIEFSRVHTLDNKTEHIEQLLMAHKNEFSPSAFGSFCVYSRTCLI